jgi:hypothetical protein
MHYSTAVAAVAALTTFVSAHGTGMPNIVGLNPRDLKARSLLSRAGARFTGVNELVKGRSGHGLKSRQDDRECGAGIGSCAAGQCCSGAGCELISIPSAEYFTNNRKTAELRMITATLQDACTNMVQDAQRT